jgi:hypothetical protein
VSTGTPIGKAIVALATLAVAGCTMVLGAVRAEPAAASGPCVAVVVDFRLLGGQVQTGCAQGDPSSGLQALGLAGFTYRPRPDGLICQIDSRPACTDTTTSRYWSYWYRAAGSSRWVYASEGPGTHNPKPGSTEGWVWQDGGRAPPPSIRAETICPQLATTPSPTPTKPTPTRPKPTRQPTAPASTTPTTGATHAPAGAPPSRGSASPGRGTSGTTASPTTGPPTSDSGTPSSTSAAAAPPSGGSTSGAAAPDPADQGGGGALGGAAGVALGSAVVLGIGAAAVVRTRRGRSP